ncbi:aromatic amino acid lyase [Virgibacillus siamensis]|uniref:aromatic amino acid lyase n=1 Tax=Virgibacillus siamensis TaxID=480071 RepID=UPI000984B1B3|nr:aromatic amino acid lyase [Virgibacillus siamensis]
MEEVRRVVFDHELIFLSGSSRERIMTSRQTAERMLAEKQTMYYGINTGFRKFSDVEERHR